MNEMYAATLVVVVLFVHVLALVALDTQRREVDQDKIDALTKRVAKHKQDCARGGYVAHRSQADKRAAMTALLRAEIKQTENKTI